MTAVPDWVPALKVATALPLLVVTSVEVNEPSVVAKVTVVPSCTAEPPLWVSVAETVAVPLSGSVSVLLVRVIVAPVGANERGLVACRARRQHGQQYRGQPTRDEGRNVPP